MSARIIRSLTQLPEAAIGGVVTLGSFDGVHLGHQALILETVKRARARGVPSVLITFEPLPREFFSRSKPAIGRLTRMREKVTFISALGIDYIVILKFNQILAAKTATAFVKDFLVDSLQAVEVLVGDDFHFGRERQGNFSFLVQMGKQHGFVTAAMPTFLVDGERVSSTRVRAALLKDDQTLTKKLLGRPYTMQGRVRHGNKLGRQWGFPTANIFLHRSLAPVGGIYTVLVHGLSETPLPGVANLGVRPTVDGTRALLEVHLLDFNQDIYGRYVEVEFCHKLREEIRYPTIALLIEQIARDVAESRDYFQKQGLL